MDDKRREFYVEELKLTLEEYKKVEEEWQRVSDERRKTSALVKNLMSVLTLRMGQKALREMLEKTELMDMALPFLSAELPSAKGTVVRRRRGRKKIVDPEHVLPNHTRIRMISGKYTGYTGIVASSQVRKVEKGLDVTYFLNVKRGRSKSKRTSVKHGTLGKTWEVISS